MAESSAWGWEPVPMRRLVELNIDVYECPRCAAVVFGYAGRERHQEWHEAQIRHAGEVDA